MRKGTRLRWIAEAEARWFRDFALVQRAASEPCCCMVPGRAGLAWFDRLRAMMPSLIWTGAGRRLFPVDTAFAFATGSAGRLKAPVRELHADRVLVTVLFTDIVESTRRAAVIGDRQWRALLDRHNCVLRREISRFRGREIKNLGDGFLATFDSPARAVRCASAIAEALARLGVAVRCGLHTGEIEQQRYDISGIAVHIAARIAAMAPAGEALVSRTVRDLVTGSGLNFEDRGVHLLRGVPEEIHLFAIMHRDALGLPDLAPVVIDHPALAPVGCGDRPTR
jgi:class 3 adenylate cyclase